MKRLELLSRLFIVSGILLAVGVPLYVWRNTPLIHARMAESGGWTPDVIHAEAGKPLHLKLTSDDVVHGFAVGQMDMQSVDILPGKVTDITLIFDKPGTYTFYCTRWCGLNHWRMRGTIEVSGSPSDPQPASVPLYVSLRLDLDAPHDAPSLPMGKPSAVNGQQLAAQLPLTAYQSPDYYRSHSPYQAFTDLGTTSLTEAQRWDVVAYLWQSNTTPASLENGKQLYAQNCATCHGENGAGDGVFADDFLPSPFGRGDGGEVHAMMQTPVNFTDPRRMLGASPALLHGKILRGGMGTGMPMWGSIFTEEQLWDLVAYLYSFQFEYQP